ncbi:ornithine cyclodeaminase family protein [Asanoa sp. WMMD1127]|uniref:ornithine cyclodeaminase family protein n=1 Tax=Asanoa sp. WMMD1127 TaxID=3016107 RepID=UPI002417C50E|nr:ornithine cyclodeaminase family protein [Asanoa sp. WMMD1127]MDG4822664.1 ornithine cyclodeaminase family protein [Asanoa sp. WMMD1127]
MTLLLGRRDIAAAVDVGAALDLLAAGFRAGAAGPPPLRIRTDLPGPGTATCLMPGLLPDVPAYTVKVNAKFPAASPALRGVVCLHSLADGELLALLDSASVTAWRTGLAAALATHTLAPPEATTLGFVGAGAQAATTLAGLRHLRPWTRIVATDLDPARAAALPAEVLPSATAVTTAADVVVLATWSRAPLLGLADVRPGQHLTSLGADEPGKRELAADLLAASRLVVDDVDLALTGGALGSAGLTADASAGTLGDVLRGDLPAVAPADAPSVYSPVGLPWQDLALSWSVYRQGGGTTVDLLS